MKRLIEYEIKCYTTREANISGDGVFQHWQALEREYLKLGLDVKSNDKIVQKWRPVTKALPCAIEDGSSFACNSPTWKYVPNYDVMRWSPDDVEEQWKMSLDISKEALISLQRLADPQSLSDAQRLSQLSRYASLLDGRRVAFSLWILRWFFACNPRPTPFIFTRHIESIFDRIQTAPPNPLFTTQKSLPLTSIEKCIDEMDKSIGVNTTMAYILAHTVDDAYHLGKIDIILFANDKDRKTYTSSLVKFTPIEGALERARRVGSRETYKYLYIFVSVFVRYSEYTDNRAALLWPEVREDEPHASAIVINTETGRATRIEPLGYGLEYVSAIDQAMSKTWYAIDALKQYKLLFTVETCPEIGIQRVSKSGGSCLFWTSVMLSCMVRGIDDPDAYLRNQSYNLQRFIRQWAGTLRRIWISSGISDIQRIVRGRCYLLQEVNAFRALDWSGLKDMLSA